MESRRTDSLDREPGEQASDDQADLDRQALLHEADEDLRHELAAIEAKEAA